MTHVINPWDPAVTYKPGDFVTYQDEVYEKANDDDQSPPDHIGGGWIYKVDVAESNVPEFNTIAASFDSYEARRDQHQQEVAAARASAEAKLEALGLTVEEIKALGL